MTTMQTYAIVDAGKVTNIILWDGDNTQWQPGKNAKAVVVPDGVRPDIGWAYASGAFVAPPASPAPELTADEQRTDNAATRNALLNYASTRIAPLQDAADLGIATSAETVALTLWKRYRVDVNRADLTQWPATWPAMPA